MQTEPELQTEEQARASEERARVARQLAELGFYVMDSLLPDDLRSRPCPPPSRSARR